MFQNYFSPPLPSLLFLLLFCLHNNSSSYTLLIVDWVPGPVLSTSTQDPAQWVRKSKSWDPGSVAHWVCPFTDHFSQQIFTKYSLCAKPSSRSWGCTRVQNRYHFCPLKVHRVVGLQRQLDRQEGALVRAPGSGRSAHGKAG